MTALRVKEAIEAQVSSSGETLTTLSLTTNILKYKDENGTDTDIDLSLYLDDTNLARITSGVYNSTLQTLVFTRDDASTFSIDASLFLDDTNLVTSVNGEVGIVVIDTDDIDEGSSNLYYTEARVSANTDVAANTAKVTFDKASEVAANTAKVTFDKASEVAANTAKVSNIDPVEYTATIAIASWTGTAAPFSKAVTVSGILSTDRPIIDLDLSSATYSDIADIEAD